MSIFGNNNYGYQNSGGGSGINLRVIAGLVIAAIGVISYLTHTEVNPVTGEKQHISISVDQEKALGLQAAPQMAQEMGGIADDSDPRTAEVKKIGQELLAKTDAGKSPYTDNFHFNLLRDNQTINAFSLPGGQVFITAALYDRLENEAQLAGVLGHECGHVIGRHGAEQMATGQLGSMLVTAIGIGASDSRGRGQLAAMAAAMANSMLQLRYSRDDEFEADHFGLQFMSQAGYDPSQMRRVMEILKQVAGKSSAAAAIFQTHPDPDARIDRIDQFLKENYPNGVPGNFRTGFNLKSGAPTNVE